MSKPLSPTETNDAKLTSSTPSQPLVKGHRDAKIIVPLSQLQSRVDDLYHNILDMQREYGPSMQLVRHTTTMLKVMDLMVEGIIDVLSENKLCTKEQFEQRIDNIRTRKAAEHDAEEDIGMSRVVVDKAAELGDTVCLNFKGKVNNEYFEGGEARYFNLVLGSKSFIDGFEDQLVGSKAGDKKEVMIHFPGGYGAPQLADKDAVFEVEVISVKSVKKES